MAFQFFNPKQPIVGGLAGQALSFLANKVKQQAQPVPQRPVPPQRVFQPTYQQATQVAQNIKPSVPIPSVRQTVAPIVQQAVRNVQTAPQRYDIRDPQKAMDLAQSFIPAGVSKVTAKITPKVVSNPVQKIISALSKAKPIRGQQETLYSQERTIRAVKGKSVQATKTGETGFYSELGKLKGELPRVQFESIRPQFTQTDVDSLFKQVAEHPKLQYFESVQAREGLAKLLGERGGGVPAKSQISLLDRVFGSEFTQAVMKNRSGWEKFKTSLGDAINLPRAVSASLDLSAPLRQGLPLVTRKEFWKSLGPMVKSFTSEKSFRGIQEEIASRPTYQLMQDAKLALTDIGGLLPQEEAFMTNFAGKLPGIRASNRAYIGFLNKLRADTFDSLTKGLEKEGRLNPDALKSVASFVNTATGRGDLPNVLSQASGLMNGLFFSPRLMASRAQLLNPQFYLKQDPYVRKELLKSIIGATSAVVATLSLSKLAGASVGTDPRNADFAKAKVGNTRYDLTGGFGAYIRIASQLISGKLISSTTGKETELGEGYKPLTRFDIFLRFLQNKESPVASLISSLAQGKNPVGEPLEFTSKNPFNNPIAKMFIPMLAQDMYDAYQEWGGQGIAMATPSVFGVGTQTYGYNLPDKLKAQTEGMGREERKTFTEQARQVAVARAEGQTVSDEKTQILETFEQKMEGMDIDTKQAYIRKIATRNPKLAKDLMEKTKESYKDEQRGMTPIDAEVKKLPVPARAKYIDTKLRSLSPEQRRVYFLEIKKKGILTKDVWAELRSGQ